MYSLKFFNYFNTPRAKIAQRHGLQAAAQQRLSIRNFARLNRLINLYAQQPLLNEPLSCGNAVQGKLLDLSAELLICHALHRADTLYYS